MPKHNLEETAFVLAFMPAYIVNSVVDVANQAKKTVVNKIDDVRCELHNRRHFDKKHPHLAPKNK
jgi:arginine utilization protein RocB